MAMTSQHTLRDDLGEELRRTRMVLGLSQASLAAELGVGRSYVAQLETGRPPSRVLAPRVRSFLERSSRTRPLRSTDVERVLGLVRRHPGLTVTALRQEVALSPTRAANAIDRAINEHLVVRLRAPGQGSGRFAWRFYIAGTAPGTLADRWKGAELERRLGLSGMSQASLARELGVSPACLTKWKRGGVPAARVAEIERVLTSERCEQIRQAMQHAGWSAAEFGRRAGATGAAVQRWLRGEAVSGAREPNVRRAIDAAAASAPRQLSAHDALLAELTNNPSGLYRTGLTRWRRRYGLDRRAAAAVIEEAIMDGGVHEELDQLTVGGGRVRTIRRLVLGPVDPERSASTLTRSDLRELRERAELSRKEAAALLGVKQQHYVNLESGNAPIPPARGPAFRTALEAAGERRTPVDEKAREILQAASRKPGIGRTELLERHVGDSGFSRRALQRAIEDNLVHERLVELRGRGPYVGLYPGPAGESETSTLTGSRLRELREAAGLMQAELASGIGVSRPSVCTWERRNKPISSRHVPAIADLLEKARRTVQERATARAQERTALALEAVTELVGRFPGISQRALARHIRRPGTAEVLEDALRSGQIREERRLYVDRAGRPRAHLGLYEGRDSPPASLTAQPEVSRHNVWRVRRGAGLTQAELGAKLNVSQATVAAWETGRLAISEARRTELHKVLEVLASGRTAAPRRLPRSDVPTVAQLVAERPGITRGRLVTRVNAKRRRALTKELRQAVACGDVHERRVHVGGRVRVELHPGPES